MGIVTDRKPAGPARVLSFEAFVRRSVDVPGRPEDKTPESPFIMPGWMRPLSARQILHRQAMLRNFQRQG